MNQGKALTSVQTQVSLVNENVKRIDQRIGRSETKMNEQSSTLQDIKDMLCMLTYKAASSSGADNSATKRSIASAESSTGVSPPHKKPEFG
eukprot:7994662-Karenia_brevis.AAC.1